MNNAHLTVEGIDTMIPTLKTNIDKMDEIDIVLFSHGVFDLNGPRAIFDHKMPVQTTEEAPCLGNLHQLKCGTLNSSSNNRIESATEVLRDLSLILPGIEKSMILVDCSTRSQGRNLQELHKVATTVASDKIQTTYVTSISDPGYRDEIIFGIEIEDDFGSHRAFPAACVVDRYDCAEFDACKFQNTFNIPIFLDVQAFGSFSNVLEELPKYANQQKVCVFNFVLSNENSANVLQIIHETNAHICINSLGRGSVYSPLKGPMPFNDEQIVDFLFGLSENVLKTRVMLSVNISAKIMTRGCGGPGYAHMIESVIPRLFERCQEDHMLPVKELISKTALSFLSWFVPPKGKEIEMDHLNCHVCHKQFPAASEDRYEKFGFIYCSSACLLIHKRRGFEKNAHRKVDLI